MAKPPIYLTPDAYAAMQRQGSGQLQGAQQSLDNTRHWTQALGDVLLGLGGQARMDMAQKGETEASRAANARLAAMLTGDENALNAAIQDPRTAQAAFNYKLQAPQREAAAFELAQARQNAPLKQDLLRAQIAKAKAGPAGPAALQQYNFAKSQGYQGSFLDYQKELKAAGKAETTINMPGGDKLSDEIAKKMANRVDTMYEGATQAAAASANVRGAEEALMKGTFAGAGAKWVLGAAEVLDRLGIAGRNTQELIANTRQYIAQTGAEVGQAIKMFGAGTGLSDADRDFAQQIAGGKIEVTPKALAKIIRIRRQVHQNTIKRYNELRMRLPKELRESYYPKIEADSWEAPTGPEAPQVRAQDLTNQTPQEGSVAENPSTGEVLIFQGGKWVPAGRIQGQVGNRFNFGGQ